MVIGIKNGDLVLVKSSNVLHKLVFKNLDPSYKLKNLSLMELKPTSHKGKGIIIKNNGFTQPDHGLSQKLEIGNEKEAISVFLDQRNHIHWS